MKRILTMAACVSAIAGGLMYRATRVEAQDTGCVAGCVDKVTLCHADGHAGTTKFSTINIACSAARNHISETGTPQAGHEDDYCGPCEKK